MFGGFGAAAMQQRYRQHKGDVVELPRREVSAAEFTRLAKKAGLGDDVQLIAKISAVMGGYTRIGNEMLRVKSRRRKAK